MAREATQAELLTVVDCDYGEVTSDALKEAIRFTRFEQREECFWKAVEWQLAPKS